MKKTVVGSATAALAGLIVCSTMIFIGCEDAPTAENGVIVVSPASTETTNWVAITFVASASTNSGQQLYLPLDWSISNLALGRIRETKGVTMIYETLNAVGVQTITVRDQADAEGSAVVAQSLN